MSLDYKNWSYGTKRVSADFDTVENAIIEGQVKAVAPSATDLTSAAEWLALYACDENLEIAQTFANVIAFLELNAESKQKRSNLAQLKREYAAEKGIKVSQVRLQKKAY